MGDSEEQSNMDTVDQLEQTRGQEYGYDAWRISSAILRILPLNKIREAGFLSPVASMVRKLVRAVNDPTKAEHWADMEVYIRLIRKATEQPASGPSPHGGGT